MMLPIGNSLLRVPRAPFEHWALDRCGAGHLAMPWITCSRPGLKAGMEGSNADDPLHTDWMLGAGLDPLALRWYGGDEEAETIREAAHRLMSDIQAKRLNFRCNVLAGHGIVSGRAYVASTKKRNPPEAGDIVILPDAAARWFDTVIAACATGHGAVIVEKGGAMAHLVLEALGQGINVVRVERATKLYQDGQMLVVDCSAGEVKIMPVDLDIAPNEEVDQDDSVEFRL